MVTVAGNGLGDLSSNLNEAVDISHNANPHGKDKNLIILPPAMGKIIGQTGPFCLGIETGLGEGNLWI